jgi:protein AFG1
LGAADYIAISQRFDVILLANIPKLNIRQKNEARRLIILIDALYENHVKLICTAEAPPEELFASEPPKEMEKETKDLLEMGILVENLSLFSGEEEIFMFNRAISRLKEMQTEKYLRKPHQKTSK